jgi:hypothetical protein
MNAATYGDRAVIVSLQTKLCVRNAAVRDRNVKRLATYSGQQREGPMSSDTALRELVTHWKAESKRIKELADKERSKSGRESLMAQSVRYWMCADELEATLAAEPPAAPRRDLYGPACEVIEPLSEAEMAERMKAKTDLSASDLAALDSLEVTHPNLWYYIREVGQACQLLQQENLTLRAQKFPESGSASPDCSIPERIGDKFVVANGQMRFLAQAINRLDDIPAESGSSPAQAGEHRWEVVPGEASDDWGIRREGEGTGKSIAQMLWERDAIHIVDLHNAALRSAVTPTLEQIAQFMDDAECLPTCDSVVHDDLCPYVNPGNAIRAMRGGGAGTPMAPSEEENIEWFIRGGDKGKCFWQCDNCGKSHRAVCHELTEPPATERAPTMDEIGVGDLAWGLAKRALDEKWSDAKLGPAIARFAIDYRDEAQGATERARAGARLAEAKWWEHLVTDCLNDSANTKTPGVCIYCDRIAKWAALAGNAEASLASCAIPVELQQAMRDVLQEATGIIEAVYQELGSTEEVSMKTYARIERWRNAQPSQPANSEAPQVGHCDFQFSSGNRCQKRSGHDGGHRWDAGAAGPAKGRANE